MTNKPMGPGKMPKMPPGMPMPGMPMPKMPGMPMPGMPMNPNEKKKKSK